MLTAGFSKKMRPFSFLPLALRPIGVRFSVLLEFLLQEAYSLFPASPDICAKTFHWRNREAMSPEHKKKAAGITGSGGFPCE